MRLLLALWFGASLPGSGPMPFLPADGRPEVLCEVNEEGPGRTYRLFADGAAPDVRWWLALRGPATRDRWVALRLPGAQPVFGDDGARLVFRSANGGIVVDLEARSERASLDVYVSYELEVNVDASLTPAIDLLNTDGRLTNVTCEVAAAR